MAHEPNELLRKSLHIAFGLFAVSLRWLPWWLAAGVAAAAVAGNWLILHRLVGTRVARHERGWDAGTVLYPAAVFGLIVLFRHDLAIAGVAWVILAFGDGFATIAGRTIGGRREGAAAQSLPWNADKTWAGFFGFILFGYPAALAIASFLSAAPRWLPLWLAILVITVVAAICESLPIGVNDNIVVPFAAGVAGWILIQASPPQLIIGNATGWLIANTVLAAIGYAARSVDLSGAAGGWLLGAILIVCGGPHLYLALLAFFVLGTAATKLGYKRKSAAGLAQEKGGRRGFGHAFSNVGVAAILAIAFSVRAGSEVLWIAAVASLATAAADTVASEIGQLFGRRCFLPLTLRPVPRGTEGAISVEGTIAGIVAAALVAVCATRSIPLMIPIVAAAAIGSYLESIAGHFNRSHRLGIANGALNFFNTAAGAVLVWVMM